MLYARTGPEQTKFRLFVRLGGYSGEAQGEAYFDDISVTRIEAAPAGAAVFFPLAVPVFPVVLPDVLPDVVFPEAVFPLEALEAAVFPAVFPVVFPPEVFPAAAATFFGASSSDFWVTPQATAIFFS